MATSSTIESQMADSALVNSYVTHPTEFLSVINPVPYLDPIAFDARYGKCTVLELFDPMGSYTSNARGFGERNPAKYVNMIHILKVFRELLGVFGNDYQKESGTSTKVACIVEFLPRKEDFQSQDEIHEFKNPYLTEMYCDIQSIAKKWEKKIHNNKFVAIRYRIFIKTDNPITISSKLQVLLIDNEKRIDHEIKTGFSHKRSTPIPAYQRLTTADYIRFATGYAGFESENDDYSITSETSRVVNPNYTFGMFHSNTRAHSFGACDECCKPMNYIAQETYTNKMTGQLVTKKYYTFPFNGEFTYQIPIDQMMPDVISKMHFPFIRPDKTDKHIESNEWTVSSVRKSTATSDMYNVHPEIYDGNAEYGTNKDLEKSKECYEKNVVKKNTIYEPDDLEKIRKKNSERVKELYAKWPNDCPDRVAALKIMQIQQLVEVKQLWTSEGTLPESIRAQIKWGEKFLEKSLTKNFCMTSKKTFKNISPLAEKIVNEMVNLEYIMKANTCHRTVMRLILACHQLGQNTAFRINNLDISASEAGKSFAQQVAKFGLIKDTYLDITVQSLKTLSGDMDEPMKNTMKTMFWEEMPPTVLGIKENGKGGQVNTSNTDMESMIKSILTTGKANFDFLAMLTGGGRKRFIITIHCSNNIIAACNALAHQIPFSVQNRFFVNQDPNHKRSDPGSNVVDKILDGESDSLDPKQLALKNMSNRNQYICTLLGILNYLKVIGFAIDRSASNIVFSEVLSRGKDSPYYLKNTDRPRNGERLGMAADVLVFWDVIANVFDSETSPLIGKKWNFLDIIHATPFFRTTTEMAALAFGLFESQYQDYVQESASLEILNYINKYKNSIVLNPVANSSSSSSSSSMERVDIPYMDIMDLRNPDSNTFEPYNSGAEWQTPAQSSSSSSSSNPFNRNNNEVIVPPVNDFGFGRKKIAGTKQLTSYQPTGNKKTIEIVNGYYVIKVVTMDIRAKPKNWWEIIDTWSLTLARSNPMIVHETLKQIITKLTKEAIDVEIEEDITETVETDGKQVTRTRKEKVTTPRYIIEIDCEHGTLKILKSYLDELDNDTAKNGRLFSCVRDVLSHPYALPQNVLYGNIYKPVPYLMAVMEIIPNKDKKVITSRNHNYYDALIIQMSESHLMNAYDTEINLQPFKQVQSHKYRKVSRDIDSFANYNFIQKNKFHPSWVTWVRVESNFAEKLFPSTHPLMVLKKSKESCILKDLKSYPRCFAQIMELENEESEEMAIGVDFNVEMDRIAEEVQLMISNPDQYYLQPVQEEMEQEEDCNRLMIRDRNKLEIRQLLEKNSQVIQSNYDTVEQMVPRVTGVKNVADDFLEDDHSNDEMDEAPPLEQVEGGEKIIEGENTNENNDSDDSSYNENSSVDISDNDEEGLSEPGQDMED